VRATRYCHRQHIGFEEQVLEAGAWLFLLGNSSAGRAALGSEGLYSSTTWAYACAFERSYSAQAEDEDAGSLFKARPRFCVWLSTEKVQGCGKERGGHCSKLHGPGSKIYLEKETPTVSFWRGRERLGLPPLCPIETSSTWGRSPSPRGYTTAACPRTVMSPPSNPFNFAPKYGILILQFSKERLASGLRLLTTSEGTRQPIYLQRSGTGTRLFTETP